MEPYDEYLTGLNMERASVDSSSIESIFPIESIEFHDEIQHTALDLNHLSERLSQETLPRWKKPYILYAMTCMLITASIAMVAAVAVISIQQNRAQADNQGQVVGDGAPSTPSPGTFVPSPTKQPILPPTVRPTPAPTVRPTPAPTVRPTPEPTFRPTPAPTVQPTFRQFPVSWYVMGDTPYKEAEEVTLVEQLEEISNTLEPGAMFTVHVGDFQRGKRTDCTEQYYASARELLRKGPLPTFVLAGDNDYIDCPDKEDAWELYQRYFCTNPFEEQWNDSLPPGVSPLNVTRFNETKSGFLAAQERSDVGYRPEMFSFVEDGIFFMSLTLINDQTVDDFASSDWRERLQMSALWASMQANTVFSNHEIRGVVLFGHALLSNPLRPFFMDLKDIFESNNYFGPTLYMHGDGHRFQIEQGYFSEWDSFTGVQVDQGGKADPLLVRTAPRNVNGGSDTARLESPLVAEGSNQHVIGNGLFLIDRRGGRYDQSRE